MGFYYFLAALSESTSYLQTANPEKDLYTITASFGHYGGSEIADIVNITDRHHATL